MTKKFLPFGICLASLAMISASKADFSYNFNSATPTNPPNGVNFAPQDNWTITVPGYSVSSLATVGSSQAVLLGGLVASAPVDPDNNDAITTGAYTLSRTVSEVLTGKTYSLDFSVFNRSTITGLDFDNTDFDDTFTINLGGSNGFSYELAITPPAGTDNDIRDISMTGSTTTGGIVASDLASLSVYKFEISFVDNGADLDYVAKIIGSSSAGYVGKIVGQAGATLESIGFGWDITSGDFASEYGFNGLMIDNINFTDTPVVPETSAGILSLLAMGAMGLRRRR